MDQRFLIPICWVPDTDQKYLIHIIFGVCGDTVQKFLVPIFAVRGAIDHKFLILIIICCLGSHGSDVTDPYLLGSRYTDQKLLIHINFGICGSIDQKFLVPIFAVRIRYF